VKSLPPLARGPDRKPIVSNTVSSEAMVSSAALATGASSGFVEEVDVDVGGGTVESPTTTIPFAVVIAAA